MTDRLPPQNREAEAAALGSMMMSTNACDTAAELNLNSRDFYTPAHQSIHDAIKACGNRVDELNVVSELKKAGKLDDIGGQSFVYTLTQRVPAIANHKAYMLEVLRQAQLRTVVAAADAATALVYESSESAEWIANRAASLFADAVEQRVNDGWTTLEDALADVYDGMADRFQSGRKFAGLSSPWAELDRTLGGLSETDLVIVAARPAMGKSALAMQWGVHVARSEQKHVAMFSREMGETELAARVLSIEAQINGVRISRGMPYEDDFPTAVEAIGRLSSATQGRLLLDTRTDSISGVRAKCRKLKRTLAKEGKELGLIIFDYLQLAEPERGKNSSTKNDDVSAISRGLKQITQELKVPVIALSQLSRGVESRPDKKPQLSDLRDSGAIEQDANAVVFLVRPEVYHPDNQELKGLAQVEVAKNRGGPTGALTLGFRAATTEFVGLERVHIPGSGRAA